MRIKGKQVVTWIRTTPSANSLRTNGLTTRVVKANGAMSMMSVGNLAHLPEAGLPHNGHARVGTRLAVFILHVLMEGCLNEVLRAKAMACVHEHVYIRVNDELSWRKTKSTRNFRS